MADAQVKITDLKNGISACKICIGELKATANELMRDYQNAGSNWKDEQYASLGEIVENCCDAIQEPIPKLEDCLEWLQNLTALVEEYEGG